MARVSRPYLTSPSTVVCDEYSANMALVQLLTSKDSVQNRDDVEVLSFRKYVGGLGGKGSMPSPFPLTPACLPERGEASQWPDSFPPVGEVKGKVLGIRV